MSPTLYLETTGVASLVALVVVLVVRTAVAERSAALPSRVVIRRLDVAACGLAAVCVTALVTTMVAGVLVWG